jgi:hypothetical protein
METNEDRYLKVSDYDVKGSRHNFHVFLNRITSTPWKAFVGALVFSLLGVLMLIVPSEDSVKFSSEWSVWIPVTVSMAVAVWFFSIGVRAIAGRVKG